MRGGVLWSFGLVIIIIIIKVKEKELGDSDVSKTKAKEKFADSDSGIEVFDSLVKEYQENMKTDKKKGKE